MKILIRGDFTKFYFNFFPQIVVNIRWGKKGGGQPPPLSLMLLAWKWSELFNHHLNDVQKYKESPHFCFFTLLVKLSQFLNYCSLNEKKKPFKRFNFTVNFLFSVMISPSVIITFITNIYDFWNSIWRNGRKELASEIFLRYLKS